MEDISRNMSEDHRPKVWLAAVVSKYPRIKIFMLGMFLEEIYSKRCKGLKHGMAWSIDWHEIFTKGDFQFPKPYQIAKSEKICVSNF